jgi:hypothetical protein
MCNSAQLSILDNTPIKKDICERFAPMGASFENCSNALHFLLDNLRANEEYSGNLSEETVVNLKECVQFLEESCGNRPEYVTKLTNSADCIRGIMFFNSIDEVMEYVIERDVFRCSDYAQKIRSCFDMLLCDSTDVGTHWSPADTN